MDGEPAIIPAAVDHQQQQQHSSQELRKPPVPRAVIVPDTAAAAAAAAVSSAGSHSRRRARPPGNRDSDYEYDLLDALAAPVRSKKQRGEAAGKSGMPETMQVNKQKLKVGF